MTTPLPTTAHNQEISGDTLTSVSLNYEWRRFVVAAVAKELKRQFSINDDGTMPDNLENWLNDLILDFYEDTPVDNTPVGIIVAFANYNTIPAKWLYCNGAMVSQATYPDLYAIIGSIYGATSGGNFRLPELRQRMIYGALNAPSYEQGVQGGVEATALSISNVPSHNHTIPAHSHIVATASGQGTNVTRVARGDNQGPGTIATDVEAATVTGDVGAGASFNIMNPHLCVGYMIKALP